MDARRQAFVRAYIGNGFNATQAAIIAGYSAKTATSQGQRLLTFVDVKAAVHAEIKKLLSNLEEREIRWLNEVESLAYAMPIKTSSGIPNVTEMNAKVSALKLLGQYMAILHDTAPEPKTTEAQIDADTRRERIAELQIKLGLGKETK